MPTILRFGRGGRESAPVYPPMDVAGYSGRSKPRPYDLFDGLLSIYAPPSEYLREYFDGCQDSAAALGEY